MYEQLRHIIMLDVRGVIRKHRNNIRFYVTGEFIFEKAQRPGVITEPSIYLKTAPVTMTRFRPIEQLLENMYENLAEQISEFTRNGTGWVLKEILKNIT